MFHRLKAIYVVIAMLLALLTSCVSTSGSLFQTVVEADSGRAAEAEESSTEDDSTGDGAESTEDDATGGSEDSNDLTETTEIGVRIESFPDGASVFLKGDFLGLTPLFFTPDAGSYRFIIEKDGYYPQQLDIEYVKESYQYYEIQLIEITGYLDLEVDISGADISINGLSVTEGVTELAIGRHTVIVKAFGFEEFRGVVTIREQETTNLTLELNPAELEISGTSLSRSVVNPINPGRLGEVVITFEVTTFGAGSATITDASGNVVRSIPLGPFHTWSQSAVWDARTSTGEEAQDGNYIVSVRVKGDDGAVAEATPIAIEVSRGAVIAFRTGWTGVSGMLYTPTAEMLPASSFQVSVLGAGSVSASVGRIPLQLFVRIPVAERWELGVQSTAIIGTSDTTPFSIGASGRFDVAGSNDARSTTALAIYGVATYLSRTNADTQTNYTGARAGAVGTLRSGPLRIHTAIELAASRYAPTYLPDDQIASIYLWSYARGGVMVDTGGFSAGVSAALRTVPFAEGLRVQTPFEIGGEAHWLIPGTYVVLSAAAIVEIESTDNYYFSGGGGLGIIH